MVGGDEQVSRFRDPPVNEDYDVQLRLDASGDAQRSATSISRALRAARARTATAWCGSTTSCTLEEAHEPVPHRPPRPPARRSSLRAGVAPGYALADRLEALQQAVDGDEPAGRLHDRVAGRGRELERTFGEFIWAFLLSVIFMYMILASQYESLVHPLTILLSLPLSVPFALLSLWATGNTLNLYSALGMLVLFGVVKKNSILQIDHMNNLRAPGHGPR